VSVTKNRMSTFQLRAFKPGDAEAVNAVVASAYGDFKAVIPQWADFSRGFDQLTAQAENSEVIVAERDDGVLLGAVGYVGPGQPKRDFFDPSWPVVRWLSVLPQARGLGLGQGLVQECICRAQRDQAPLLALHTSAVMLPAQRLYQRLGFDVVRELQPMFGVPYVLMNKPLLRAW
jgi:ribosomal protein S18 acetylase RimI-like enzyme